MTSEKKKNINKKKDQEEKIEENKKVPDNVFWHKLYLDFFKQHSFIFFI